MCEDRKKRLQEAVTRFKQGFADRPTRALDELLSRDAVGAMVDEEVEDQRGRTPLISLNCGPAGFRSLPDGP